VDAREQLQQEPDDCANSPADDSVLYTLIVGDYNDVNKMADALVIADACGASCLKVLSDIHVKELHL
jgi:hypothetical protein